MARITLAALANAIDRLGKIKATMANLAVEEKEEKDIIIKSGKDAFEGALFRATVSTTQRSTTDYKAVLAKLVEDKTITIERHNDLIEQFSKLGEPTTTVRVVARSAANV